MSLNEASCNLKAVLVGNEHCLALADGRLEQSLRAGWTREPKTVPGQGSSNAGLVLIHAAVRGELLLVWLCMVCK